MQKQIYTEEDLARVLQDSSPNVVVVKFGAAWCAPCRAIAPAFAGIVNDFESVVSVEADYDSAQELFVAYDVLKMPTFIIFKDGATVFKRLQTPRDSHEIRQALKTVCPLPTLVLDGEF